MADLTQQIIDISRWVDRGLADKDPEAQVWHRVAKIGEEHGEVIEALIGATNGNPRKPNSHTMHDVGAELLDVALCALAAYVHVLGGDPMEELTRHANYVHDRAGLAPEGADR